MRPAAPAEGRLTEWLLRAFALLAIALAISNLAFAWWRDPSRWTVLLLLLTESYTLLLVLFARRAVVRDLSLLPVAATFYAVAFVVLLEPDGTVRLAPEWLGVAIQLVGVAWQLAAKVTLGRSFGLLPARRGLVTHGPYRFVRHPIYLGYLVGHVAFLLVNFSWRNLAVLALLYVAQLVRIAREEHVLSGNEAYGAYRLRVRWRLLPFVY